MTDIARCGTCKFRGEPITKYNHDTFEEDPTSYFLCKRIEHDVEWKYLAGKGALTVDGSGYKAALCVEDDFGCVKWESP